MTQGWFLAFGILVFFVFENQGFADRLGDAERRLADSKNQYFDTLIKKPGFTPEEARQLRNKTIDSSYREVHRVLDESNRAFASKHLRIMSQAQFNKELEAAEREEARSPVRNKTIRGIGEFVQTLFGGDEGADRSLAGSQNAAPGSDYVSGGGGSSVTGGAKKRSPVIDGKGIPKVIEFPGPKKKVSLPEE